MALLQGKKYKKMKQFRKELSVSFMKTACAAFVISSYLENIIVETGKL
jgi:hypothetical protein